MIPCMIAAAIVLTLTSGVPGLFLKRGSGVSQVIATVLHLTGCAFGIVTVVMIFAGGSYEARFAWPLPGGFIGIHLDRVAAFFLLPLFIVMGAGSIYGQGYWNESAHSNTGRKLRFFFGTLTAGFAFVIIAADAWSFLAGWEIVGLSAFFLVITESEKEEALRAGWIYLIATHVSTLLLFCMFALIHSETGTWHFDQSVLESHIPVILLLALAGFGIKAGLMPFHVWLPEAHAAAPSHISAILSGLVLKMGVYGLIRLMTMIAEIPSWFGIVLLFGGIVSGILGVVFALAQHDLKRLLAYHSIENIGIIFIGLGVAVLGQREAWGVVALAGALLHVWNHALFKALLFFAAGAVIRATGTRAIDTMGGLIRKMPATGMAFLVGAIAISGLPPLNGFVSEWLIYIASFTTVAQSANAAILAVPALALIGALAVACFVKAFSVVFLGTSRSTKQIGPYEEPFSMRSAMTILVLLCFAIGLWPLSVYGSLTGTAADIFKHHHYHANAEIYSLFSILPAAALAALALILLMATAIAFLTRKKSKTVTWDCGYAAPTERMQYTASSFASPQVQLFRWALRPEFHQTQQFPLFPQSASFETHVPDPVLNKVLLPGAARARRIMGRARIIQAGRIQIYIVYIVVTLLILLAWSAL